MKMVLKDFMAC